MHQKNIKITIFLNRNIIHLSLSILLFRFIRFVTFSIFHRTVNRLRVMTWLFIFLDIQHPFLSQVCISCLQTYIANHLHHRLNQVSTENKNHEDDNHIAKSYFLISSISFPNHDEERQHTHGKELTYLANSQKLSLNPIFFHLVCHDKNGSSEIADRDDSNSIDSILNREYNSPTNQQLPQIQESIFRFIISQTNRIIHQPNKRKYRQNRRYRIYWSRCTEIRQLNQSE